MRQYDSIGVRLPGETRQQIAQQVAILSISQSSLTRALIHLALDLLKEDPSLLLKRSRSVEFSGE